ncbi:MAG: ABC transporter substrate-binding protein [Magnetovibrio sp.]|nr:ABC transporter substrate-binding protein [Magnetovibrio sp.]
MVVMLVTLAVLPLTSCDDAQPIKIGYVGGLTGRYADLGQAGRDGALLAIELANQAGGLNGRPIELIVKDDGQDPDVARIVGQELIVSGVVAVVGHMTSSMSVIGEEIFSRAKVPLISPTTSTNHLSARDDYFFRVYPSSKGAAKQLAQWVGRDFAFKSIVALYDLNNRDHAESWLNSFDVSLQTYGGNVVEAYSFDSQNLDAVSVAVAAAVSTRSDGVFVLANALDSARIIQNLRKSGDFRPIFVSEWSATDELLRLGGGAVDGVKFLSTIDLRSKSTKYQSFRASYFRRFKENPSFAAIHAGDTVRFLLSVLERDSNPKRLKRNLLSAGKFEGLQRTFFLNEFGDVNRELFRMTVKGGRFVPAD